MSTPIIKLRDRTLSAAVFEFKNQDGSVNLSVNIQRSFKKKGESEYTTEEIHCYEDDLLKLANLCTQTYNRLVESRAAAAGPAKSATLQATMPIAGGATGYGAAPAVDDMVPF